MAIPPSRQPASGWKAHTPNALVGVRLLVSVVVFVVLATWSPSRGSGPLVWAAVLFVLAAVTDALDGALARRWNAVTAFGRIMDPFADKVLVLGSFLLMAGPAFMSRASEQVVGESGLDPVLIERVTSITGIEIWMVVLILSRELLVTSIRGLVESRGLDFSATGAGKAKMIVQSVAIPAILLLVAADPTRSSETAWVYAELTRLLAWTTVLVTVWSAIPYVQNGITALRGGTWYTRPKSDPLAGQLGTAVSQLTVGGLGFLRPAPGTWGSLPPVVLAGILIILGYTPRAIEPEWPELSHSQWVAPIVFNTTMVLICIASSLACVRWGDVGEGLFGKKDAGQIVADETAGQSIALIALPITAATPLWQAGLMLGFSFLAFRAFDIVKLWPARGLQKLPGGWGVLVDDLIAGVQALVLTQLALLGLLALAG